MENSTQSTDQPVTPDEATQYITSLPDITPVNDKQRYAEGALAFIIALPPLIQDGLIKKLAKKLDMSIGAIRGHLKLMASGPKRERAAPSTPDGYELTDSGNAKRLAQALAGKVRYAEVYGKFLVYHGGVWAYQDSRSTVRALAAQVVAKQLAAAREAGNQDLVRYWLQCEGRRSLDSMVELLIDQRGVKADPKSLDRSPQLLNFTNGTLDLSTRVFREHRAEDMLTQQVPHRYNPDAPCPIWESFLAASLPNADVRDWSQRWDGACLAEGNREQLLRIDHGVGGSGKGTRRRALDSAMGKHYARKLHRSVFERGSPNAQPHPTNLMDARKRRLVYGTEINPRLYIEQLKELTGGDTLKARSMGKDFEDLDPTWRTEIQMNTQPIFPEDPGGAIEQRLRIIPWTIKFRGTVLQDKDLDAKLAAEAEGILAWLVRGYYLYAESGLPKVDAIEVATRRVLENNDPLQEFLHECCEADEKASVDKTELFERRQRFNAQRNQCQYETMRKFNKLLEERGYVDGLDPVTRRAQWLGIKLRNALHHESESMGVDEHSSDAEDRAEYARLMTGNTADAPVGQPAEAAPTSITTEHAQRNAAPSTACSCTPGSTNPVTLTSLGYRSEIMVYDNGAGRRMFARYGDSREANGTCSKNFACGRYYGWVRVEANTIVGYEILGSLSPTLFEIPPPDDSRWREVAE